MSNSWFQFRQFTIHQDRCAMKVSTDACIQGAWTPVAPLIKRVLDIGTGSALLSLMLAQRLPGARIDAVEWNESAAQQAKENAASSPFAGRIAVHHADASTWLAPGGYDLIICNPPFFKNSLQGPDSARNAARHSDVLNPNSLVDILSKNLTENGVASVMWPPGEHLFFSDLAEFRGLFLQHLLEVRDKETGRITRIIGMYGKQRAGTPVTDELVIKSPDGGYTPAFTILLSPFYLHL